VEHVAPASRWLVGGVDGRALLDVALLDDMEEHVGGVIAVSDVADLVDHQDVWLDVAGERLAHAPPATGP